MKITDFVNGLAVVAACLTIGDAVGAATYNCQQQHFNYRLFVDRDRNQFLYKGTTEHDQHNTFYCGHEKIDGCDHNIVVLMPAGHVFEERSISNPTFYRCDTAGGNSWILTNGAAEECWEKTWGSGMQHVYQGMGGKHYFCKQVSNGVCVDKFGGGTSDICWMSDERYTCLDKGGQWKLSDGFCSCKQSGYVWDKSVQKCVESLESLRDKCNKRNAEYDVEKKQCTCKHNTKDWMDKDGHCHPIEQCPTAQGYTCEPGQVVNISLSEIGNIIDSGNSNVNTNQQNQQVNDNNQTTSNSSENNNSNENHNNSDNGNTTVVGDNNNVNVNNGGGGISPSTKKCLEDPRRKGKEELLACCYLSASGVDGGNPNFDTGKCVCNSANRTFSIVNGRGRCIGNGGGGGNTTPQCPDRMYYNATEKRCMCSANNQTEINNNTECKCAIAGAQNDANGECKCDDPNKIIVDNQCVYNPNTQCPGVGMRFDTTSGLCKCINPYQREINNNTACECTVPGAKNDANGICKCNEEGKTVENGKCVYDQNAIINIRAKITASYGKLNSTVGGFEKSVWKDAEGNFNTARLASDSIAGVVLGTAGGIITSKLVKKNQLKKGFEDIKCSIGGQNVASYGDSFSVGM